MITRRALAQVVRNLRREFGPKGVRLLRNIMDSVKATATGTGLYLNDRSGSTRIFCVF